jgi:hypothetical protein
MGELTGAIHTTITISRAGGCMKATGIMRTMVTTMTTIVMVDLVN